MQGKINATDDYRYYLSIKYPCKSIEYHTYNDIAYNDERYIFYISTRNCIGDV